MNRAIARAIEGKRVDDVAEGGHAEATEHSRGAGRTEATLMATVRFKGYGEVEVSVGTSLLEGGADDRRPRGVRLRRRMRLLDVPRVRDQGGRAPLRAGGRGGRHPRQGVRRARAAPASGVSRGSSDEGVVEVEITRESLEAFENEHPEARGKYVQRARTF